MKQKANKEKSINNYREMKFRTFCWSLGTTSFRVKDLAHKLYKQLIILKEIKAKYSDKSWQDLQGIFYDKMHEAGLATGKAKRREKDARQFTSSLVQLGLADEERTPTETGEKLIKVIESGDADRDNILKLPPEAFIFLKQFMKLRMDFNERDYKDFRIKPYTVIVYMILALEYLTYDELTYFVPLCGSAEETAAIIEAIKKFRSGALTIDGFLRGRIERMRNYKSALDYFLKEKVNTPDKFSSIGLGRKGKKYDEIYFHIFRAVLKYKAVKTIKAKKKAAMELVKQLKRIKSGEIRKNWLLLLFGDAIPGKIKEKNIAALDESEFVKTGSVNKLKTDFFYFLHINMQ